MRGHTMSRTTFTAQRFACDRCTQEFILPEGEAPKGWTALTDELGNLVDFCPKCNPFIFAHPSTSRKGSPVFTTTLAIFSPGDQLSVREIAYMLGHEGLESTLRKRLSRMVHRGMLVQPAPGLFALPE
ncbi:hypothetical protein [Gordonia phage GTE2]|uniref:Uncharacterized protein n=1 Tax=Gordonia phage GTE2 TaxID=981323 RepID=F8S0V9_9CAUD|nr:hypothetical protein GoPhGTE2_gp48 [Gordonia phage GTE2]ADX42634.1 hypothetical protein [Gordonia phage GTE2]